MTRHFFLIALLSVLLPAGFRPADLPHDRNLDTPRHFIVALRAMPGAARALARADKRTVARPVGGVYLVSARRPSALRTPRAHTRLPDRPLGQPAPFRAPPAFA